MSERYVVKEVCEGQVCVYDTVEDEGFVWFENGSDDWQEKAAICAAALNAAEHNAKREELLREAEFFIRTVATDWTTIDEVNEDEALEEPGCGFCEEPHGHTEDCTAAAWLARFAALEQEGKDAVD